MRLNKDGCLNKCYLIITRFLDYEKLREHCLKYYHSMDSHTEEVINIIGLPPEFSNIKVSHVLIDDIKDNSVYLVTITYEKQNYYVGLIDEL